QGNRAVHDFTGTRQSALDHLRIAWRLAVWFHRAFGPPGAQLFKPGAFVLPEDPTARLRALEDALSRARAEAAQGHAAAEEASRIAQLEADRRAEAEAAALRAEAERAEWEAFA